MKYYANTGGGPTLQPIDIGHPDYLCLIEPDTAFWALVKHDRMAKVFTGGELMNAFSKKAGIFKEEMEVLRFTQSPSAVYFNPTERCNLNCSYCYIPEKMRHDGHHMSEKRLLEVLELLKNHFTTTLPAGTIPQVIFHGAEPLLNRDAIFSGIDRFRNDFLFGLQTNATLLDEPAVEFLKSRDVSVGISLDGPTAEVAGRTRKGWDGKGVYKKVTGAMELLKGYRKWSVICTITNKNMRYLTRLVEFFHKMEAPACMLNVVRCTLEPSRADKAEDMAVSGHFIKALDRTRELYEETGRKLPVANFANILLAIIAPTARRLMCDISPCGGGRCFFAVAPSGDLFPCSEFIGLEPFNGGNIFKDDIDKVLVSSPFGLVTGRKVEDIKPCGSCAIRHFCGSPCPAEANEMNGGMETRGAFCRFYEEQVRYAFRVIAYDRQDSYLWDGWERDTVGTFVFTKQCV